MNTDTPTAPDLVRLLCCSALLFALTAPSRAQTALVPTAANDARDLARYDRNKNGILDPEERAAMESDQAAAKNDTITLNPFEVNTTKDTSYGALNSNAIAAFNMELLKAPVAADIFTEQFMQDVGATTVEDLLNGYARHAGERFQQQPAR